MKIVPLSILSLLSAVSSYGMIIDGLTFDSASDITSWNAVADTTTSGAITWLDGTGNPGGAIELSGTHDGTGAGKAYIMQLVEGGINFSGATDYTLSFDAKLTAPLVGSAVHVLMNLPGVGQVNNFDIQGSLNDATWTNLTFDYAGVQGGDVANLQLQIAAGAFAGAGGGVAFDNIQLTAVPEPSTYAAMIGLLALGFVVYRRRR